MSLKWLLAIGLIRKANKVLSDWADNKWIWKDDKSVWHWETEVAVVTGGSNGIGAMVAKGLVSNGIKVAVIDVQPLSEDLINCPNISFYQCDVTSRGAVQKAGKAIRAALGSPSILINNAGIGNAGNILDVSPEKLRAIFDVNLISQWYTVQEFLPDMIEKRKGHIMSTASMASFLGIAGMVDYCSTKVGALAFHEGLAQEIKYRYNCPEIKTTIIHPGWTRTRLVKPLEKALQKAGQSIMDPKTVADAMVRQILEVKGGQIILGPTAAPALRALPSWLQERIRDKTAQQATVRATTAVA